MRNWCLPRFQLTKKIFLWFHYTDFLYYSILKKKCGMQWFFDPSKLCASTKWPNIKYYFYIHKSFVNHIFIFFFKRVNRPLKLSIKYISKVWHLQNESYIYICKIEIKQKNFLRKYTYSTCYINIARFKKKMK